MKFITTVRCMLLTTAAAVLALAAGVALAHEQREGEVQWVVGFLNEPAYEGQVNGVYLKLTKQAPEASGEEKNGHDGGGTSMDKGEDGQEGGQDDDHGQDDDQSEEGSDDDGQSDDIRDDDGHNEEGGDNAAALTASHDQTDAVPVEGAEKTLQVEVTHVPTDASKVLNVRPLFNAPGEYVADLIPTAPGVYEFRFFGAIDDEQVEETFVSEGAGGDFDDVRSSVDLQFPVKLPELREIEGAVRGAQNTAAQAQDTAISAADRASSAGVLATVGIVLGAIGIAVGVGGVAMALKRR